MQRLITCRPTQLARALPTMPCICLVIRLCSRFLSQCICTEGTHTQMSVCMCICVCPISSWTSRTAANWASVVSVVVKLRNALPISHSTAQKLSYLKVKFCVIRSSWCMWGLSRKHTLLYKFWSLMVSIAYVMKLYINFSSIQLFGYHC